MTIGHIIALIGLVLTLGVLLLIVLKVAAVLPVWVAFVLIAAAFAAVLFHRSPPA